MTAPEQKLAEFRAAIDRIDAQISQLLLDRCAVVRQVAALKAAHWPADCHIRSGREGQMHRAIAKRFQGTDMPPATAITIWRQLIGAATQLESPLTIATLASASHHAWLAREYFGTGVTTTTCATIADLCATIAQKRCNIVLLAAPIGVHWHDAATLHKKGLRLFAQLPATAKPLPNNAAPAFAFAPITPEPSGDDISYFLRDGRVECVQGFQESLANAVFLGACPRPLSLKEIA